MSLLYPGSARETFWTRAFLFTLAFGFLLIFLVPYRVPVDPAWSDSYMFGYSNRAGEALFLALAVCLGLIARRGGLKLPDATRKAGVEDGELSRGLLFGCLGCSTLIALGLYLLTHSVGGLNDGAYFLDRIHLIDQGKVPYRDFEFVYGSLSLYGSIYLGRLLSIGAVNGYYLLWLIETLTGVWLLWLFLRWIDIPSGGRRRVFLIFYTLSVTYQLSIALNYCLLRYTLPLFAIVAVGRVDRGSSVGTRLKTGVLVLVFVNALLDLSPEEGLAFACASVMYLPLRRHGSGRPYVLDLALLIPTLLFVYRLAGRSGVFGTMKGFAAGAFNLPIFPSLHILIGSAAMLGLACYVATGAFRQRAQSNVCFLAIYSLGMAPGALGRCDTTHMGGYEMGALIAPLLVSWRWPAIWQVATWSVSLTFILLPFTLSVILSQPTYTKALLTQLYARGGPHRVAAQTADGLIEQVAVRALGPERGRAKLQALRASVESGSLDPHAVFSGSSPRVAVPLGYLPNKLSNYQSPSVDEGYFMGLSNVVSPQQIDEKIAELRDHPEEDLVVSPEGFEQCLVHEGSRRTMEALFLIPYVPAPKHAVTMFVPLCTYIASEYTTVVYPSPAKFGYGLMRRRGADVRP